MALLCPGSVSVSWFVIGQLGNWPISFVGYANGVRYGANRVRLFR